jgi:hypothetical protein
MNRESNIIQFKPKTKRIELYLPSSNFHIRVQSLLFAIIEAQDELSYAYILFGKGGDIWKDQCERAIDGIQLISQPIQEFYQLVLNTAQLPADVVPFRYPLVIILHRMDEQVHKLSQFLTEFHSICRKPSRQRTRLRQSIEKTLNELMQNCYEVQLRTNNFFNCANQVTG